MNIFLDSNIIIEDYNLKKGDTILFLNNFEDAGFQCFISKVTYLEVLSNYTKHLTDKTEKFNSALDSINRQTENDLSKLDKKFIEMETSKYKDKFDSKLRQYNITICPLPKIEHSEILRHSLDKKKPFDITDAGYKDFLIYNTMLENINKFQNDIIFVTKDNDFGKTELHEDLKVLNVSSCDISLRNSLIQINQSELNDTIKEGNAELAFVLDLFDDASHSTTFLNTIIDHLNSNMVDVQPLFLAHYLDKILDEPLLDRYYVNEDSGHINSLNAISPELIIVDFTVDAYLSYFFSVKQNYISTFKNWPEDFEIELYENNSKSFVSIGSWFCLQVKVQSDKNGMNIEHVEVKMIT